MKCNVATFRNRLLQGEQLRLDTEHLQMARLIYDDFTHLYHTLLAYYDQTIDTLKCAEAIKQLRQHYYEVTGTMAHEPDPENAVRITIKKFWNMANRLLLL